MVMLNADATIDTFLESLRTLKTSIDSGVIAHIAFVSSRISSRVDALFLKSQLGPDERDAYHRSQCLPGTRVKIQKDIVEWASSCSDQNVFWLHGVAGSGKSAVSTTIAEHFRTISRLGAHLFFERGKSDPSTVIWTLAYKLAAFDSSVAKHVSIVVEQDEEIARATAAIQFESLIQGPLTLASDSVQGPVVIVLDALDECGAEGTRRSLLDSLRKGLPSLPKRFRFLITSRKEVDISHALSSLPNHIVSVELEHDSSRCRDDVLRYIDHEMRNVFAKNELLIPGDWQLKMDLLGGAAGGLFIWASTVVKLVDCDDPVRKLEKLISHSQGLSGLDQLYDSILRGSRISFDDEASKSRFSQILGFILLGKLPLTDNMIDKLLEFSDDRPSRLILSRLQPVLVYTPGSPIRFCHTSFRDYLLAPERQKDPWFIDLESQKELVALQCFYAMSHHLRFNICNIESSYCSDHQIPDLPDRISANVPPQLPYACMFWPQHLYEAQFSHELLDELTRFLHNRLLYWLEVMNLLGRINVASPVLLHAMNWVSLYNADILAFLRDARRMITIYLPAISQSTAHIYVSFLLFASMESKFVSRYLKPDLPIVKVEHLGESQHSPLLKVLTGHARCIACVAFSPNGARVASGSWDNTVRIWDAESGDVISGPLEGHEDHVRSVAFSPDGARVISGSDDKTIRAWDIKVGQVISEPFKGHTGPVHSVAFSPDGLCIASGSADRTVMVWNVKSGKAVSVHFEGHVGDVNSVAFSPDGRRIVSGSDDKTVRIWDIGSGQTICRPLEGHTGRIWSVAFSHDGRRVVSGSADNTIRIWNAELGQSVSEPFKGHEDEVNSVAFSHDGKRVVSGSSDTTIRIWDTENGQVISTPFEGHALDVLSVVFSSDGTRVVSGSIDYTIRIWDAESVQTVSGQFEGHAYQVTSVAYSPDGRRIASGSFDGTIRIWDCDNGNNVSGPFKGHLWPVWSVAFSPDGGRVVSGSADRTIRLWDVESGRILSGPFQGHEDSVQSVSFSPEGTRVVSGSCDKTLRIWDAESGQIVSGPFKGHEGDVQSVAFAPDGRYVVSGSTDNSIILWDVESGNICSGLLRGHTDCVQAVAFSRDGTHVSSGSSDKTVLVWNVESGQVVAGPFKGHTGEVKSVAFSPDGTRVVSGSTDMTIRVWDVKSGRDIFPPLESHIDWVRSVDYSPDGRRVVSGSLDRTIRIWNVEDAVFDWTMNEDGWICRHGMLLLWIPPNIRRTLWRPQTTAMLNCAFSTKLDFTNAALGERWQECFARLEEDEVKAGETSPTSSPSETPATSSYFLHLAVPMLDSLLP
ncbi:WD40 repeat-like protein [Fomitiporia mediterranea MF3/22]|uniref:WD40 repeat-like protein n=1 Tax=Fomitiporia mediterranea (strain MF3/22) TaxID=694068 RepID=UPI000440755A|nr:WD40 repeat-like protein [Fomitiporia mediterranea MF3/22]EJC98463.1 WD40 repeat-like protein [Fomitiporia mediterranea MF3/22]